MPDGSPQLERPRAAVRAAGRGASIALATLLWVLPLAADEAVRVDYLSPPGCPGPAEFMEKLRSREPSARAARAEELARRVSVAVQMDEEGYRARLDFVDVRGDAIVGTLFGATCDEVVTGIALVSALAIEAQREDEGREEPPVTEPVADVSAPPPDRERLHEPVRVVDRAPVALPRARRPRWRIGFGIGGGNSFYAAPEAPFSFDPAVRVGHDRTPASVRASFRYWSSDIEGPRRATFRGMAAGIEGCPIAWPASGPLKLEPCLAFDLGRLEGRGEAGGAIESTRTASILWADARGIARFRIGVTPNVELEVQGDLGLPLVRHQFVFESPRVSAFDVPSIGPGWRSGAMLHIP
jgi:hypothetical protein